MIMKKWLSHFAYNQRSRSGWTFSSHLKNTSKSNLIGQKTVTYVPGTFVTLVPGPNTLFQRGKRAFNPTHFPSVVSKLFPVPLEGFPVPLFIKEGLGEIFSSLLFFSRARLRSRSDCRGARRRATQLVMAVVRGIDKKLCFVQ